VPRPFADASFLLTSACVALFYAAAACGGHANGANPGSASGSSTGGGNSTGLGSGASAGTGSGTPSGGSSGTASGMASGNSSGSASGTGSGSAGGTSGGGAAASGGPSVGCGQAPPAGITSSALTIQTLSVPSCATGPITPDCVSPDFSPGGVGYLKVGQWDFNNRNYGVELPPNYDPTKPYPLILEGGGCVGGPTSDGGGFSAGETNVIRVGLSYVGQCFADGGVGGSMGFGCAPDAASIGICVNTPEVPYVNAVLDDLESHLCVDLDQVFIAGIDSGAFESSTVSCALSERIRGMATVYGGLRINRPACTGPTAAIMVVAGADDTEPIGPLVMDMPFPSAGLSATQVNSDIVAFDSYGSAPMRDELLKRNGCTGTATAVYDPAYSQCVTYTGCPVAYPVVWCELPGLSHLVGNVNYDGTSYVPGTPANPLLWNFLAKLAPL
jgi:hypothetical protein